MNESIVREILHELFSSLEALETQSTAILQLLKDKGVTSGPELALHLELETQAASDGGLRKYGSIIWFLPR